MPVPRRAASLLPRLPGEEHREVLQLRRGGGPDTARVLDYLRTNKFEQADDTAFIRERADRAAETYERARLEGYPADGAQELAMDTLLRGLHYSRYAILREVVENEFADEVPEEKREAFVLKLLPLVGNVFSVYDLSDDNFALSSDYDLLYTELTGATVLYLDEYGV